MLKWKAKETYIALSLVYADIIFGEKTGYHVEPWYIPPQCSNRRNQEGVASLCQRREIGKSGGHTLPIFRHGLDKEFEYRQNGIGCLKAAMHAEVPVVADKGVASPPALWKPTNS
jgi:hypothetical protein